MDQNSPIDAEKVGPEQEVPKEKSGRCCVCGCLGLLAFSVLAVVGSGIAGYWFISSQVARWTADTPSDLPVVEFTEDQFSELDGRLETFEADLDEGRMPERLELTAEEINALIARDDDMKGRVFVRIEDGLVSGDISVPMDAIPGGKGRFLNASASFDARLENGVLVVTLTAAEVKGEPLPDEFIQAMARENLAKEVYKDPEVAATLSKFESIEFVGDKIILQPRGRAAGEDATEQPEDAPTESDAAAEAAAVPASDETAPDESESEPASDETAPAEGESEPTGADVEPGASEPAGDTPSPPADDPESGSPAADEPTPAESQEEPAESTP